MYMQYDEKTQPSEEMYSMVRMQQQTDDHVI